MAGAKLPPGFCPKCGRFMQEGEYAERPISGAARPGDFLLCAGCAAILRYTADMQLGIATKAELAHLKPATLAHMSLTQMQVLRQRAMEGPEGLDMAGRRLAAILRELTGEELERLLDHAGLMPKDPEERAHLLERHRQVREAHERRKGEKGQ